MTSISEQTPRPYDPQDKLFTLLNAINSIPSESPGMRCLKYVADLPQPQVIGQRVKNIFNKCIPSASRRLSRSESLDNESLAPKQVDAVYLSSPRDASLSFNINKATTSSPRQQRGRGDIFIKYDATPNTFDSGACFDDEFERSSISVKKQLIIERVTNILSGDDESILDSVLELFNSRGDSMNVSSSRKSPRKKKSNIAKRVQPRPLPKILKRKAIFKKRGYKRRNRNSKVAKRNKTANQEAVQLNQSALGNAASDVGANDAEECTSCCVPTKRKRRQTSCSLCRGQCDVKKSKLRASDEEKENASPKSVNVDNNVTAIVDKRGVSDRLRPHPTKRAPSVLNNYITVFCKDTKRNRKLLEESRPPVRRRKSSVAGRSSLKAKPKRRTLYSLDAWLPEIPLILSDHSRSREPRF